MRIKAARRTTDNRGRAEFVRGLVERIECTFEHRHVNGKKAGRLSSIRFVPWSGEPAEYCTDDSIDTDERVPRRSSRASEIPMSTPRSTGWRA